MVDYLDEFKLFLNEDNSDNNNDNNDNNDDNNETPKKFVEDKEIYEIVDNESFFTINSKDRNLINETAFDFSINFGTNNPNKINISKNFRNIVEVDFLGLIIPDFYVDIKEVLLLFESELIKKTTNPLRLKRISDLPYLLLNITELKNTNSLGSNQVINNASFVLVLDEVRGMSDNNSGKLTINGSTFLENGNLDKTVIGETVKRNLYYKCFTNSSIKYNSPQNYLGNIQASLRTPEGILLKNLNDFLKVYRVYKYGDGVDNKYRLRIKFYDFFSSEEFRIGDRILFKDIGYPIDESIQYNEERILEQKPPVTNFFNPPLPLYLENEKIKYDNNGFTNPNYIDRFSQIIQFLEREEGHTIIEVAGSAGLRGADNTESKLYNEIGISFDSQVNLDTFSGIDEITGGIDGIFTNTFNMSKTASAFLTESITPEQYSQQAPILQISGVNEIVGDIEVGDIIDGPGIDRAESRFFTVPFPNDGIKVRTITTGDVNSTITTTIGSRVSNRVLKGTHLTFHKPFIKKTQVTIANQAYEKLFEDTLYSHPTENIVFAQGKCINLSNQTTLGLKIRNKEKRLKSVKTELL